MNALADRRERGGESLVDSGSNCGISDACRIDDAESPEKTTDEGRRKALKAIAGLSVYVAPAMTVLLPGAAGAHHKPWHQSAGNGGNNCRGWAAREGCSAF
jgi:hypothetical protein